MLDARLVLARPLRLGVAHPIMIILNVRMEGGGKIMSRSSDSEFPLLQLAVLLPQVEQLLPRPLHLELQLLELRQVHLGARLLDYITGEVLNSLLSSLRLSQIYSSFCSMSASLYCSLCMSGCRSCRYSSLWLNWVWKVSCSKEYSEGIFFELVGRCGESDSMNFFIFF